MSNPVDRLRGGGAPTAIGTLTIDRSKAREKLRRFRLPDPHFYVLQFVRAASVLGANRIDFEIGVRRTVCTFDAVLEPELLGDLWGVVFEERRTPEARAAHHLALGVGSAQALNPQQLVIESGARRLTVFDEEEVLDERDEEPFTRIEIVEKLRPGHVTEFFTSYVGRLPEARALVEYCGRALVPITVDGLPINRPAGFTVETSDSDGSQFVTLRGDRADVDFQLLSDNVRVTTMRGTAHASGAIGAMNGRSVPTDLSGLAYTADDEGEREFRRRMYGTYHRALRLAAQSEPPGTEALLAMCRLVAEYVGRTGRENVDEESLALLSWVMDEPLFDRATSSGVEPTGLTVAMRNAAIEYATRPFELEGYGHVVLSPGGRQFMNALSHAGYPVRDVTDGLAVVVARQNNERRWEQRIRIEPPAVGSATCEVLRAGALTGVISLSDELPGTGKLYLDGRMLRAFEGLLPYEVSVFGGFETNAAFDDVTRDEAFDDLAMALLDAALPIAAGLDEARGIALLTRVASGSFDLDFLKLLGFGREQAAELLKRRGPRTTLEDVPGLYDRPWFGAVERGSVSLREIVGEEASPMLGVNSELARADYGLLRRRGGLLLRLDSARRRLVEMVRPDAVSSRTLLDRMEHEKEFRLRPRFVDEFDGVALVTRRVEVEGATLDLLLTDEAQSGQADVFLLWEDRLLAHHHWTAPPGSWRVVVRSDRFQLTEELGDVVRDGTFRAIQGAFGTAARAALRQWRQEVAAAGSVGPRGLRTLWELNRTIPTPEMVYPVLRYDGSAWQPGLASTSEMLEIAASDAGHLRYATTTEVAGGARGVVLHIAPEVDAHRLGLQTLGFERFSDVTFSAHREARNLYRQFAERPRSLSDAQVLYKGVVDGLEVETGLYDGESFHMLEIVWDGRVLESLALEAIARCRTKVRGDLIVADPECRHVEGGREEARHAAAVGAHRVIVEAAHELAARRDGALDKRCEAIRDVLLAALPRAEGTPLQEILEHTPLFDDSGSGRRSLAERRDLTAATPGENNVLSRLTESLRTARGDRQDLLDDHMLYSLRWAVDPTARLCHIGPDGVEIARTHPLVQTAMTSADAPLSFLASALISCINAYYAEISDTDEIELQARLLRAGR